MWLFRRPRLSTTELSTKLEVIHSDVPLLGHRVAYLSFRNPKEPFKSLSDRNTFGVDSEAVCLDGWGRPRKHNHAFIPDPDCSCGFYAYPPDIESDYNHPSYVKLIVELSGIVIECETGLRSEHLEEQSLYIPSSHETKELLGSIVTPPFLLMGTILIVFCLPGELANRYLVNGHVYSHPHLFQR